VKVNVQRGTQGNAQSELKGEIRRETNRGMTHEMHCEIKRILKRW